MTTSLQQEAIDALKDHGSQTKAAKALGISRPAFKERLDRAGYVIDPAIQAGMDHLGMDRAPDSGWIIGQPNDDGIRHSFYFNNRAQDTFVDTLLSGLSQYTPLDQSLFAPRISHGAKGENLFVIDLADVHFGKLCSKEETGAQYGIDEARHRVIEGTRSLLRAASGIGVARILFVMGNDILHTDNGKTTTSGTPQDAEGTYFQSYRAAQYASIDAINECAAVADVDLIHCMSNHDWRSGWALSQTIAATFKGHSGVRATDYNMSEIHRKYYGFERNGFLLTHGDGTKEEKIIGHFMQEAKTLVSTCDHFYALLHHFHHKTAKRRGVDVFQSEKDHNGMTAIVSGSARVEGSSVGIEYVRSPSAPDGWHHRNGYMNRQAVECFGYHPIDGQRVRFTEWM